MRRLSLAVCLLTLLSASHARAAEHLRLRDGLPNAFRKFAESQKNQTYTKIAYFGGTATAGQGVSKPQNCYRDMLSRQLRTLHPGAVLSENNAAIAGTGSWLGAFRTKTDPLYGGAAMVFVEFSVDDAGLAQAEVQAAVEGIVRQIISRDSTTDVCFLYAFSADQLEAFRRNELPPTIAWYEAVADHYGVPSVNMARYVADKIVAGAVRLEDVTVDGRGTSDKCHALYIEALQPLVTQCCADAKQPVTKRHPMPKPLSAAPMDKAQCVPYEWAKLGAGWKAGQRSPIDRFLHVLESDQPGATLTLAFQGSQVGYFDALGPDCGSLEFSIDGGDWQKVTNFDAKQTAPSAHARKLAAGLDAKAKHELRLRIAAETPAGSRGRFARIGYLLVDGDVADPLAGLSPLAQIDAIYAGMAPLQYTPPANRWDNLARTMQKLREGPSLRIVMLGDSIIGDTSSSQYELLLERMYPKCKVEKIRSVRGSTGCWWYKDENRVEEWVLKHQPDLLMIGGISQRGDLAAIESVIKQVRAKQSPEILLMTPAFGKEGDPHFKGWTYQIDPAGADYRAGLLRLAQQEHCGFVDMTGPWWQYVEQSGKDYGWFRRDAVHANGRGFQILGRTLEKFFAPQ